MIKMIKHILSQLLFGCTLCCGIPLAATPPLIPGDSGPGVLEICTNGKALLPIVVSDQAPVLTRRAAEELKTTLDEMTGADFAIVNSAPSPAIRILPPQKDLSKDTLLIRNDLKDLVLTGGGDRGPLYAVYELLDLFGCTWPRPEPYWRAIPCGKKLAAGTMDIRSTPHFPIRGVHERGLVSLWHWMAWNRLNYQLADPPAWKVAAPMAKIGVEPLFMGHALFYWLSKEDLTEHPAWNPVVGGKRLGPPVESWHPLHRQACLSNPEVRAHILAEMRQYLREHPEMHAITMMSNDGGGYCECENCKAFAATPGEVLFKVAGELAQKLGKEFPNLHFIMMVYGWHAALPSFRLPDNMYFAIVNNSRNYVHSIRDPENQKIREQMEVWNAAYPGRVFVYELWHKVPWDDYMFPFDRTLSEDIRYYRDKHMVGLCPEGLLPSPAGENLRRILLWNPDADVTAETRELCRRLYGNAAAIMSRYYEEQNQRLKEFGLPPNTMRNIADFIRPVQTRWTAMLAAAAAAVETDKERQRITYEQSQLSAMATIADNWRPVEEITIPPEVRAANLIKNGSFEAGLDNWGTNIAYGRNFKFETKFDTGCDGTKALCMTVTGKEAISTWGRTFQAVKVNPKQTYILLGRVRSGDKTITMQVRFTESGKIGASIYDMGTTGGKWYQFSFRNLQAPDGEIVIYLTSIDEPVGSEIRFDDLILCDQKIWDRVQQKKSKKEFLRAL